LLEAEMELGRTPSLSWLSVFAARHLRAVVAVVERLLGIVVPLWGRMILLLLLYPCYYPRDILIMLGHF
jgi:hypothetical protein